MGCDSLIRKLLMPLNHVVKGGWFGWSPGLCCALFLLPTLGCPTHGRVPYVFLAYVLSQRRLFKHHPVSTTDFQGRSCSPPMCCATCGCCCTCQPLGVAAGCCSSVTQLLGGAASGMHSFCHDPCPPALGDSGWCILILLGNENHILFRL